MGFYRGPNTVTDGLVLSLDAGNTKSYTSGSTTWFDKSGYGNNGILVNGPGFNSQNGGSIVFDGSNDFVNLGNSTNVNFNHDSPWTVQFTVKVLNFVNNYPGFMIKGTASLGNTGINIFYISNGTIYWKHNNGGGISVSILTVGNIYTLAFTYSGSGNVNAYVNGVFIKTVGGMSSTDTTSPLYLGRGDEYSNNGIYTFLKYNRALTAQEVLKNYNATKSRYI